MGELEPTGAVPTFMDDAISQGLKVKMSDFTLEEDTEAFRRPDKAR